MASVPIYAFADLGEPVIANKKYERTRHKLVKMWAVIVKKLEENQINKGTNEQALRRKARRAICFLKSLFIVR
jgi:IS1 family transposase